MNAAGLDTIAGALQAYSEGTAAGQAAHDADMQRQQRRQEVAYRRKIMDSHLQQMQRKEEAGIPELEINQLKMQLQQQNDLLARQATFSAFDLYSEDADTRHLNRLLDENQVIREQVFPSVLRVDNINLTDSNDARLFSQQTGTSLEEFASIADFDAAKKRFLKVTTTSGEQKIVDIAQLYAGTGYTKYKTAKQREALIAQLDLRKKAADVEKDLSIADKNYRQGTEDWVFPPRSGPSGTAFERNAEAVGAARTRIEQGKGTPTDFALLEQHDETTMGNTPGKQRRIDQEEQNLFSSFGGEQGFYNQMFEPNTQDFNRAMRSVRKIEALAGIELSNKQVETIGNIRKTIAAGRRAAGLQPGDVGLVDNVLKKLGAYVSDDAMGAEARSAWAGIRNQLLHAFAGSAMNEGELERWGEQFGNLYQQGGHVLTTLANALDQLGGELDGLRTALPEASFHVRLGSDVERLNTIITNISAAAATLSNKANPQGKMQPMQPSYPVNPPGYQTGQREVQQPPKSEADKLREMLLQRQQRQGAN